MVEEIALARLKLRMPLEDVELRVRKGLNEYKKNKKNKWIVIIYPVRSKPEMMSQTETGR